MVSRDHCLSGRIVLPFRPNPALRLLRCQFLKPNPLYYNLEGKGRHRAVEEANFIKNINMIERSNERMQRHYLLHGSSGETLVSTWSSIQAGQQERAEGAGVCCSRLVEAIA